MGYENLYIVISQSNQEIAEGKPISFSLETNNVKYFHHSLDNLIKNRGNFIINLNVYLSNFYYFR
jgi:hypothetical protein